MQIGMLGSTAHVLSNPYIADKKGCMKDITKEAFKDTAVLTGTIGAAGAVGAAAVKLSPKAAELVKTGTSKAKELAAKVLNGDMLAKIKNSGIYKKAASLPAWAKAGLAVAAAVGSIITPIILTHSAQKSAKIEAQYEQ